MIPSFMVYQTRIKLFYLQKWGYCEENLVMKVILREERDEIMDSAELEDMLYKAPGKPRGIKGKEHI